MRLLSSLRSIRQIFSSYDPLIKIYIKKKNILSNLNTFQKEYPKVKFAPVLKSNAYGHGLLSIARILDKEDIAFLVVDSLYEARTLRNEGIKSKILIIGYTRTEDIVKNRLKSISFAITSFEELKLINESLRKKQSFHLKIDTGMHRQGVLSEELPEAIEILKNNSLIILEGVYSHFADADNLCKDFCSKQVQIWNKLVRLIKKNLPQTVYFHLTATGGTFYLPKAKANVARLGLGLYGMDPSKLRKLDLKPALEVRSIISGIKKIQKGDLVGYGLTFEAKKEMQIAIVPAGYFEGIDRRLSNIGHFKLGRIFCPIVGRVSMNMTIIDVTRIKKLQIEDPIVLISDKIDDLNSVSNFAKLCQTIPYELLVHLPWHLRREII